MLILLSSVFCARALPSNLQNFTYEMAAMENGQIGMVLSDIVAASDDDSADVNRWTCYEIVDRMPKEAPFRMESAESRRVVTVAHLDREAIDQYFLVVKATDCRGNAACGAVDSPDGNFKWERLHIWHF